MSEPEYDYVEYGVILTSGGPRGALMTREWCESRGLTFEPLFRRVARPARGAES